MTKLIPIIFKTCNNKSLIVFLNLYATKTAAFYIDYKI